MLGRKGSHSIPALAKPPAFEAIQWARETPAPEAAPHDIPSLVDFIVERYHRTHLRDLTHAVRLAREIEQLYAADPACPMGLADHLSTLAVDLEAHQWREETTLFPMLRIGTPNCLAFVARRLVDDHLQLDLQVMALGGFTRRFRPSFEAPLCWQALSVLCRKLEADLREHARLEHEILFAMLAT